MTLLAIIIGLTLLGIVLLQVARINELSKTIRGAEEAELTSYKRQGNLLYLFGVLFIVLCIVTAYYYKNYMLGYGPHKAASEHGPALDGLFNVTLFFTGIVFVVTQIALFYFSYKYRYRPDRKASFDAHNNTLEIIWTAIPAVVMTYLVVSGLLVWNDVMADVDPSEKDVIEIEATGYQFAWAIRYPGPDGRIGSKNFRLIDLSNNPLGQDWEDLKNLDDIHADDIVLPVNKTVRVRITSRDVQHNFYLPHFRVKMDAVPGMPTYFVFKPTKTTEEYREELSKYKEYQLPADPSDPEGPKRWEAFDYELACAELCGKSHYAMRKTVRIVSEDEYRAWLKSQSSYYMMNVRNTDADPFKGQLLEIDILDRKNEFDAAFKEAQAGADRKTRTVALNYVNFETGSANLTADSKYELSNLIEALNLNSNLRVELAGHTDNTGDPKANLNLSQIRADAVKQYLLDNGLIADRMIATGYGQTDPIETNDTEEGRAKNRRTEVILLESL